MNRFRDAVAVVDNDGCHAFLLRDFAGCRDGLFLAAFVGERSSALGFDFPIRAEGNDMNFIVWIAHNEISRAASKADGFSFVPGRAVLIPLRRERCRIF